MRVICCMLLCACGRVGFDAALDGQADSPGVAKLDGSFQLHTTHVDLSALGTADWSHWGLTDSTSFDHKQGGGRIVMHASLPPTRYLNNGYSFTWSDGMPTATATTFTGLDFHPAGSAFSIEAPADPTQRTLTVYTDVFLGAGTVKAALSDGSAPPYRDSTYSNTASTTERAYTFTYAATSPGQTLTVTLTLDSVNPNGNLAVAAATLTAP